MRRLARRLSDPCPHAVGCETPDASTSAILPAILAASNCAAWAAPPEAAQAAEAKSAHKGEFFEPETVTSTRSVTVGGRAVNYQAIAGTLVVHPGLGRRERPERGE